MRMQVQTNIAQFDAYWDRVVRGLPNDITVTISNAAPYAGMVEYGHATRGGTFVEGVFMMTNVIDDLPSALRFQYALAMKNNAPENWGLALTGATRSVSYATTLRIKAKTPKFTGFLASEWQVSIRRST